jgi:hypothetical protein
MMVWTQLMASSKISAESVTVEEPTAHSEGLSSLLVCRLIPAATFMADLNPRMLSPIPCPAPGAHKSEGQQTGDDGEPLSPSPRSLWISSPARLVRRPPKKFFASFENRD